MKGWLTKSKTDLKPEHPKSSWAGGPKGDYDGVPRQYLGAKSDQALNPKRKSPWDK